MGSGHFLVAAIRHIESAFAVALETHPLAGVERELVDVRDAALTALARVGVDGVKARSRSSAGRSRVDGIYGLDVNDIAVELARLAIWVRTFVPGLPMSSLDHQLVIGNSLTGIGTTDEALAALDPTTAAGAISFTGEAIRTALADARRLLEDAASLKETSAEEARAAQEASRAALAAAEPARLLFDAALAVRLALMPVPADFDPDGIGRDAADDAIQAGLGPLAPVHFPARFPEVFLRESGGFDVLVGNPPWEEVMVDETTFWSTRMPAFRGRSPAESDGSSIRSASTARTFLPSTTPRSTPPTGCVRAVPRALSGNE